MVILDLGINFGSLDCCGSISQGNENDIEFGCRKVTIMTALKLFLMPLVGIPLLLFFSYNGWIEDPVLLFLFLFMVAAPNSINMIIVCGIKNAKVSLNF